VSLSIVFVHYFVSPFLQEQIDVIFRTEWSTLFLTAMVYTDSNAFLQGAFLLSFLKYRIYDFYALLGVPHASWNYGLMVALYGLNLFWLLKIVKYLCKPLRDRTLHVLNHNICSLTMAWNSGFVYYLAYPKLLYISACSFLLGMTTFLYHQEIAVFYDGIPTPESFWIYFDVGVFHAYQAGYMYQAGYGWLPALFHAANVAYIGFRRPRDITSASIPSFSIDVFYLLLTAYSLELFTIVALISMIHYLNPLYDLSFVGTHFMLMWYMKSRIEHLLALQPTTPTF